MTSNLCEKKLCFFDLIYGVRFFAKKWGKTKINFVRGIFLDCGNKFESRRSDFEHYVKVKYKKDIFFPKFFSVRNDIFEECDECEVFSTS